MTGPIESWSVSEVAKALDHEFGGLSPELGAKLEENAIDGPFLLALTDEDFVTELGCTNLQVKKIRRMIEEKQRLMSVGSSNTVPAAASAVVAEEKTTTIPNSIPEPLPCQPPPPGGAYGIPPSGYPSGGMGMPMYSAQAPAYYGGVPSSPFGQMPGQQPVPQEYGGQGAGMPPPMYYAPPNYNQMGPYDQYAQQQQQQQQGCACSIM